MFLQLLSSVGPSVLLLGQGELLIGNGMCLETGDSKCRQTHLSMPWYHVEERRQVHVGFPAVGMSRGGPEDGLVGSDCPPPSFLRFLLPSLFSSLLSSELEWTREAGTENNTVTHVARVHIWGELFYSAHIYHDLKFIS